MRKMLDRCGVDNILNYALGFLFGMMIFVLLLGSFRARANERTIEDLEAENFELRATVSSNLATIGEMQADINELEALLNLTKKQYEDRLNAKDSDIQKLLKKLDKQKTKKEQLKIKYQTVRGYLSKDEIFLANFIAKGGTIEDAGTWYCTAYCTEKRKHICGTGTGITASGEPVQAGLSVALSKSEIKKYPYGTHIYIEGVGERIVMDTGGGVRQKQIDCAVDTHHNAVHWSGQGDHKVWVLKEGK